MKYLFWLFIAFMLPSALTFGQPGWKDLTDRYYYAILDENGKEISFKCNREYSIMIDGVLYKAPNIPTHRLTSAERYTRELKSQFSINDCTLELPVNNYYDRLKQLEIKIIHRKDTMHIFQPSGRGSLGDNSNKELNKKSDYTLQFLGGYYFFPKWAKTLLDNIPETNGLVHIQNLKQSHFTIPRTAYDSVCYLNRTYENWERYYDEAEQIVVSNFMSGHFFLKRSVQPTVFDKSIRPYKLSWWSWRTPYFSTTEKGNYLGILQLEFDTLGWSGGRGVVAQYNFKENRMKLWSSTAPFIQSSTEALYKDSFNNVYYNRSVIKDSSCKELPFACDVVNKMYQSADDGDTWTEHSKLTQLFNQLEIRNFEFLDKKHALVFRLNKVRPKNKEYDIQQGTYYLLKEFRIIDSLQTPDDIHYNDNNNRYRFDVEKDTIFLGNWSYDKYQANVKADVAYTQPVLIKINGHWKFKILEKMYFKKHAAPLLEMVSCRKFDILGGALYLNRQNGSLVSKQDNFVSLYYRGNLLEQGNRIYLVGLSIGTLFSFDGGYNWLVYPLPLEKEHDCLFLGIDKEGIITHFNSSYTEGNGSLRKIFTQFVPVEKN